jgi:hypothetical protein
MSDAIVSSTEVRLLQALRALGSPERAEWEKRYQKSRWEHWGASLPNMDVAIRETLGDLSQDEARRTRSFLHENREFSRHSCARRPTRRFGLRSCARPGSPQASCGSRSGFSGLARWLHLVETACAHVIDVSIDRDRFWNEGMFADAPHFLGYALPDWRSCAT